MIKRTPYSLNNQVATLGQIGRLIPTCILPVAPGDTFSGKQGLLVRLSPLNHALLHDLYVDTFAFYVPLRLLWDDWENFIAEGPMDTPTYTPPTISVAAASALWRSLFMPANGSSATTYSAWSTRAYNLVYNEYFRDFDDNIAAPDNNPGQYGRQVDLKKDYYTTLREDIGYGQDVHYADVTAGSPDQVSALEILQAIAQQKAAMRRATYGTRYVDILRGFGIKVNYQMLQRPELVGIGRGVINVTDVVDTSSGGLGGLAGHGISGTRIKLKRKSFPEHGVFMTFCVVRPPAADPIQCDWFDSPRSYESFYDPGLVGLPPVEVDQRDVAPSLNSGISGSIGSWKWGDWYRSALSRIHLNASDWAPGVRLSQASSLGRTDLRQVSPTDYDTLFSDTTYAQFQVSAKNNFRALRMLPRARK